MICGKYFPFSFGGRLQMCLRRLLSKQTDLLKSFREAEELISLEKYAVAQPILQNFIEKYEDKTLDKSNMIYAEALYYQALCMKECASPNQKRH